MSSAAIETYGKGKRLGHYPLILIPNEFLLFLGSNLLLAGHISV